MNDTSLEAVEADLEEEQPQSNASYSPSLSQDLGGFDANSTTFGGFEANLTSSLAGFEVYLLNQPAQCILISLIMVVAIICNALIIHNIGRCQLKMRTVNFILIKNLCTVDLIGALVILPIPLVATARGRFDFGDTVCTANAVINVAIWFQHIVMFAMLKADRVMAGCLPFGKYPLLNVEVITGLAISVSVFSFFVSGLVTALYKSNYEPAVVLCIPDLPIGFFIAIFSVYCLVLFGMVGGYIAVLICLKKKQAQLQNTNTVQTTDYKGLERAALTSFLITISHFLLYVPTMLVIGLHGWFLHPIAILLCDMIVYSEFLIHPLVLLSTSTKLRTEVKQTLQRLCQDIISAAKKAAALLFTALIGCGCAQQHNRGRHGLRGTGLHHGAGGRDHMIYAVKTSPPITPVAVGAPSPAAASLASATSSASSGAAGNNSKEPPPIDPADLLPIKSFSFAQKCIADQENGQTYLRNHNTVNYYHNVQETTDALTSVVIHEESKRIAGNKHSCPSIAANKNSCCPSIAATDIEKDDDEDVMTTSAKKTRSRSRSSSTSSTHSSTIMSSQQPPRRWPRRTGGRSISRDEEFKRLTRSFSQMELKMERLNDSGGGVAGDGCANGGGDSDDSADAGDLRQEERQGRRRRQQPRQPEERIRRHSIAEELLVAPWRLLKPQQPPASPISIQIMSISPRIQHMDSTDSSEAEIQSFPIKKPTTDINGKEKKRTSSISCQSTSSSQEITFAASEGWNLMQTPAIYLLPLPSAASTASVASKIGPSPAASVNEPAASAEELTNCNDAGPSEPARDTGVQSPFPQIVAEIEAKPLPSNGLGSKSAPTYAQAFLRSCADGAGYGRHGGGGAGDGANDQGLQGLLQGQMNLGTDVPTDHTLSSEPKNSCNNIDANTSITEVFL